jgi:hypothetical protein
MENLTVIQLRAELKKRGLPTQGLKANLVTRLQDALEDDNNISQHDEDDQVVQEHESITQPR